MFKLRDFYYTLSGTRYFFSQNSGMTEIKIFLFSVSQSFLYLDAESIIILFF